jgi:hypothetical protein
VYIRKVAEHLLRYVEQIAREADCDTVALSSGFQRVDAHRFYETCLDYEKVSYMFVKSLKHKE